MQNYFTKICDRKWVQQKMSFKKMGVQIEAIHHSSCTKYMWSSFLRYESNIFNIQYTCYVLLRLYLVYIKKKLVHFNKFCWSV